MSRIVLSGVLKHFWPRGDISCDPGLPRRRFAAAKAAAKATAAKVLATPKASSRSAVDELRQEYDDPPAVSDPSPAGLIHSARFNGAL